MEATIPPATRLDERALVYRAQAGERAAFAALVDHYWDRLYRWLCHLTHHRQLAEDLAQEAFLKALAALGSFQVGTNFQAWLFRIAHNAFANQVRANRRVRQPFPDDLASVEDGPMEQAMTKEMLQQLARAIGRLPADYRAALLLRVEEGMPFAAIAEVLEISEENARWRVFKARQKLMDVLAPQGE